MRRIDARRKNASALRLRFSQSLASLRQRLSQAMVRSTNACTMLPGADRLVGDAGPDGSGDGTPEYDLEALALATASSASAYPALAASAMRSLRSAMSAAFSASM